MVDLISEQMNYCVPDEGEHKAKKLIIIKVVRNDINFVRSN